MIIHSNEQEHGSAERTPGFERINLFQLTSWELQERYGVELSDIGASDRRQLSELLADGPASSRQAATRLYEAAVHTDLFPCFAGVQAGPAGPAPFLTDGPPGTWSLFLEPDGGLTLVRREGNQYTVMPQDAADTGSKPRRMRPRIGELGALRTAARQFFRRRLRRSREG